MPRDIQRDELRRLQAQGAVVVEVLPREEFEHEHLPGAVSLPLDELRTESAERLLGTDRTRPVVAYCQSVD